ncbi:hypothetical protein [Variovorax sp.]|uniref:hypothetical protein n=1 Tax=Variovorax sp. TaxID=1871043 RepID=UPI003BAA947C
MSDEANDALPLPAAILLALAEFKAEGLESVSLPRLGKRLGQGASVLMRQLALMGDAALGGVPGPGWVAVERDGERWLARLSDAGRALAESLVSDAPAA